MYGKDIKYTQHLLTSDYSLLLQNFICGNDEIDDFVNLWHNFFKYVDYL
jgi:hypothetical protein